MNILGEIAGQLFLDGRNGGIRGVGDLLQHLSCERPGQPSSFCGLDKVAALDFIETVMPAVPNEHSELHLLTLNLPRNKTGLSCQHIVNRRELEAATPAQKDAKVLGVAIRGANQPKEHLCFQE